MDTKTILGDATNRMQKAVDFLEETLSNIRAGKASVTVLHGVFVDYYGSQTPVSGVARVTVPHAKTILTKAEAENARISLRNARRDAVEAFKKAVKEGMPEDESKDGETQAQKLLEKFSKAIDAAFDKKEKEIMTV